MLVKDKKLAILSLVLATIFVAYIKDQEYRKVHGTVTEVSLFNWKKEVNDEQLDRPVVAYVYYDSGFNRNETVLSQQIRDYAWKNPGSVSVVALNVAVAGNQALATKNGVESVPSIAVFYRDQVRTLNGPDATMKNVEQVVEQFLAEEHGPDEPDSG